MLPELNVLQPLLNLQYAGVAIGEIVKDRLLPKHALAQSFLLSNKVGSIEAGYHDAIKYLHRQELSFLPEGRGWQTLRYQDKALGWVNVLPNRMNNYYPKELRILKQNNTPFAK